MIGIIGQKGVYLSKVFYPEGQNFNGMPVRF